MFAVVYRRDMQAQEPQLQVCCHVALRVPTALLRSPGLSNRSRYTMSACPGGCGRLHTPSDGAVSCGPIGDVGACLHHEATSPTMVVSEELQAFVGWALELLVQPPASSQQLRNQLRLWQHQLQWATAGCRLSWTEAFALYGLQF